MEMCEVLSVSCLERSCRHGQLCSFLLFLEGLGLCRDSCLGLWVAALRVFRGLPVQRCGIQILEIDSHLKKPSIQLRPAHIHGSYHLMFQLRQQVVWPQTLAMDSLQNKIWVQGPECERVSFKAEVWALQLPA